MTIFGIAIICFKESNEEGGIALYQCYDIRWLQKVPIVHSNTYDFFHCLRIGKVLIHDRNM